MLDYSASQTISPDRVTELLRSHGVSLTQQRVEIAQQLFAQPQHLSAEQILTMVNRKHKRVSKATVYNTLALFVEHGLLREVIVDPSKIVYDSNLSAHHHFYNIDTGLLQDIPSEQVTVANLPTLPEGTAAAGIEVIIRVRNNA